MTHNTSFDLKFLSNFLAKQLWVTPLGVIHGWLGILLPYPHGCTDKQRGSSLSADQSSQSRNRQKVVQEKSLLEPNVIAQKRSLSDSQEEGGKPAGLYSQKWGVPCCV
jgi:hypothetical protein